MLNKLKQIWDKISKSLIGEEEVLTQLDISRLNLNNYSQEIVSLLEEREYLKKSFEQNICELNDILKSEEVSPIHDRIENKLQQVEDKFIEDKYNLRQQLNKAEFIFNEALKEHCDLLKGLSPELIATAGDFKYKKYLTNTLGRTRDSMPQIDSDHIDDVILHFQGKSPDAKVTKQNIKLSDLKLAQNEINEDKVLNILETIDPKKLTRFVVSKDNYLLDGNHRICALLEIDEEAEVACYKIDLKAKEALRRLNLMKVTKNKDIDDIHKAFETIQQAFNQDQISEEQYKQAYDLVKGGVYSDNAINRKLNRVGQKWGSDQKDTQSGIKDKKGDKNIPEKVYSDKELKNHAKNAPQQDLERQIKESGDAKIRQHAHEELDRRQKEESVQEEQDKQNNKQSDKKDKQEEVKFSDRQLEAIDFYQTKSYQAINIRLREGLEMPDKLQQTVNQLDSAFSPSEKNMKVYRGVTLTKDELKKISNLKEGDIYNEPAYSSTSQDKGEAEVFAFDDGSSFLFEISVPKGSDILDLSQTSELMQNEKEILLPKGSNFKVTKRDGNKITMELAGEGDIDKESNIKFTQDFVPSNKQEFMKFNQWVNKQSVENYKIRNQVAAEYGGSIKSKEAKDQYEKLLNENDILSEEEIKKIRIRLKQSEGDFLKKSFIHLPGEQTISKGELIDLFLQNIDDQDVDQYLNRNTQEDIMTDSE